jgi:hypothetical protein
MVGPAFGGGFGGPPRMEGERGDLEGMQNGGLFRGLLEMDFCTKPPNFGVEAHMEAPLEMLLVK